MFDPRFLDNFELFDGPGRPRLDTRRRHRQSPYQGQFYTVDEFRARLRGTASPSSSGTTPTAMVPLSTPMPADAGVNVNPSTRVAEFVRSRHLERVRVLQQNIQQYEFVGPYPREPPIAVAWPRNRNRLVLPNNSRRRERDSSSAFSVFDRRLTENRRKTVLASGVSGYVKTHNCDLGNIYHPTHRVANELDELRKKPIPGISAGPMNDDMLNWMVVIEGPEGTPYEGGVFFADVEFPQNYPLTVPKIKFRTRIFHPNINNETGAVYVDTIAHHWGVESSIRDVLQDLSDLMNNPNPMKGISKDAETTLKTNPEKFKTLATQFTKMYA